MRKIIIIIFAIIFLLAFLGEKTAAYIILGVVAVLAVLITIILKKAKLKAVNKTDEKTDMSEIHDDGEIIMIMGETHTDNVYASEEELMSNTKHNHYIKRSKGFND